MTFPWKRQVLCKPSGYFGAQSVVGRALLVHQASRHGVVWGRCTGLAGQSSAGGHTSLACAQSRGRIHRVLFQSRGELKEIIPVARTTSCGRVFVIRCREDVGGKHGGGAVRRVCFSCLNGCVDSPAVSRQFRDVREFLSCAASTTVWL